MLCLSCFMAGAQDYYFPERNVKWEEKAPKTFKINEAKPTDKKHYVFFGT